SVGEGPGSVSAMQVPRAQIWFAAHAWSQLPQYSRVARLTQASPHSVLPTGHSQLPPLHFPPAGQGASQPPQCAALLSGSTHCPWQNKVPSGQPQTPPTQGLPCSQIVP